MKETISLKNSLFSKTFCQHLNYMNFIFSCNLEFDTILKPGAEEGRRTGTVIHCYPMIKSKLLEWFASIWNNLLKSIFIDFGRKWFGSSLPKNFRFWILTKIVVPLSFAEFAICGIWDERQIFASFLRPHQYLVQ